MKGMIVLIVTIIIFFTSDLSIAESITYRNIYNRIFVGLSTVSDMKRKMGKPIKVTRAGMGKNYRYKKVIINFAKGTKPKVNSIIIDKYYDYLDKNCFRIGSSIDEVRKKIREKKETSYTISDTKKGIIYWKIRGKVKKIVLARSMSV